MDTNLLCRGDNRGTWFERKGWTIFSGISLVTAVFGLGDVIGGGSTFASGEVVLFNRMTGTTWDALQAADPGAAKLIDYQVRAGGAGLLLLGVLSLAICMTALRRGERWAWYAMCAWPLGMALIVAVLWGAAGPGNGIPVPVISGSIVIAMSLLTLVLSARRYLRKAPGQEIAD
jgi:hypothetical protein